MQLSHLRVEGLFGRLVHNIPFPTRPDEAPDTSPSIAILHGANGIGKTTLLRMLNGLLRLDFGVFRQVPFDLCSLEFSTGERIVVKPAGKGSSRWLEVEFSDLRMSLNYDEPGPRFMKDAELVESFREQFFEATSGINLEFIETSRVRADQRDEGYWNEAIETLPNGRVRRHRVPAKGRAAKRPHEIAEKVEGFIREAQVDHRRFFTLETPDLFPRIMERLNTEDAPPFEASLLSTRLQKVRDQTEISKRLGLEVERWDYDELMGYVNAFNAKSRDAYALTVLGAYTEFLESRVSQRQLLADRLLKFQFIVNSFFSNKALRVHANRGFRIHSDSGDELFEEQLSSGEQHLLFLMVSALTAHRRGTVIAIDEPELSMHPEWQRKLVFNLIDCASNASPQLVMATHSPEIIADYVDSLVHVG